MKQPLIILTGPKAAGKTALSVRLAKAIGGEIISADSMQVYRGMDIGSAKATKEEMGGIRHHLIDVLEPSEEFNVTRFQSMALGAMKEIQEAGHIPIVAGGTGFYIQALLYDIDFTENDGDMTFRHELERLAEEKGPECLHERLKQVDPESAAAIHPNNRKRVIRALEFYEKTGMKISSHNEAERKKESPYQFVYYVLTMDRARLYERIDARVDRMAAAGLVDEVKALKDAGLTKDMVSMQGLGYKEILDFLDGNMSLEEAVSVIKRDTRHFAKRQLTWFRRERDVCWLDWEKFDWNEDRMLRWILSDLTERGIIKKEQIQSWN